MIDWKPLKRVSPTYAVAIFAYLLIFAVIALWQVAHAALDVVGAMEVHTLVTNKMGMSERQVSALPWSELLRRVVLAQQHTRLCVVKDLTEHDVVQRIMRKENFLIAMLNMGTLSLTLPWFWAPKRPIMTSTLIWSLDATILDPLFDPTSFKVRPEALDEVREASSRPHLLI